jgi:hypothetical protein
MKIGSLLAPFTNRVHLVTLIMCIVLFCALRMSGGAVRVETDPNSNSSSKAPVSESKATGVSVKDDSNSALMMPDADAMLDPKSELTQLGISDKMKAGPKRATREGSTGPTNDSDSLEAALGAKKASAAANANAAKAANAESGSSKDGLDDIEKRLGLK